MNFETFQEKLSGVMSEWHRFVEDTAFALFDHWFGWELEWCHRNLGRSYGRDSVVFRPINGGDKIIVSWSESGTLCVDGMPPECCKTLKRCLEGDPLPCAAQEKVDLRLSERVAALEETVKNLEKMGYSLGVIK